MGIFGKRRHPPAVGDRYEKLGDRPSSWTVEAVLEREGHPPHVRLVSDEGSRQSTISASVLEGPGWRRIEPEG